MDFIQHLFDFFEVRSLNQTLKYRLILSLFSSLSFLILFYFWSISKKSPEANKDNSTGLMFLSLTFLMYCGIGFATVYSPTKSTYLLLSGLISSFLLLSLPFFAQWDSGVDRLVKHHLWKSGIFSLVFTWLLFIVWTRNLKLAFDIDIVVSSAAIFLFGFYITRVFIKRKLILLGGVTGLLILFIIWLQINSPELLGEGRYVHVNTVILSPALFLSIISIAYTFNWLNELNYRELSKIYDGSTHSTSTEKTLASDVSEQKAVNRWRKCIAHDDVERVIEELLSYKKFKNESLSIIMNLAQRNNRNNTNRLKDIIRYEEYQLNRNKISQALIRLMVTT